MAAVGRVTSQGGVALIPGEFGTAALPSVGYAVELV